MHCQQCGNKLADSSKFCSICGKAVFGNTQAAIGTPLTQQIVINQSQSQISIKNKWVAFFICLFLGWLGFHRFYVGKIGSGIIYLMTAGLFGLGWVIDGLCIICGCFTDKKGNYLK